MKKTATNPEEYSKVENIIDAFKGGKITACEAVAFLQDRKLEGKKERPWKTKEWQELRSKLIETKCKQCGSNEPPMVLQHLWHPESLNIIISYSGHDYFDAYREKNPKPEPDPPTPEATWDGCPNCGAHGKTIYFRKGTRNWKCTRCKSVLEHLIPLPVLSAAQWEVYDSKRKAMKKVWLEKFHEKYDEEIFTKALNEGIKQHKRYISCKDAVTFCKRCAFMWDMKNRKMCENCGTWMSKHNLLNACSSCITSGFKATMQKSQREIAESI